MLRCSSPLLNLRFFKNTRCKIHTKLDGNIIVVKGNKPSYGIITGTKEFPSKEIETYNQQQNLKNVIISKIKEIDICLAESEKIVSFSPTSIDYLFLSGNKGIENKNEKIENLKLYCKLFEENIESSKEDIQKDFFDKSSNSKLVFNSTEFIEYLKNKDLYGKLKSTQFFENKFVYTMDELNEYALFNWIIYGNGKEYFEKYQKIKTSFLFNPKEDKFPLLFVPKTIKIENKEKTKGQSKTENSKTTRKGELTVLKFKFVYYLY